MKLKIGDTVQVISGQDRGKRGKIEHLFPAKEAVIVEKVHRIKKHLKASRQFPKGGIIDMVRPVPTANVMIVCPHCGKLTRVGNKKVGDKKLRVCRLCGKSLDEVKKK